MSLTCALAVLAAFARAQDPAVHEGTPGPRRGIAGLGGFVAVSRLDFGGQQNRLTAVYLFPDRVRWHFEAYDARRSEHLYLYRLGERIHELRSGAPSQELLEEARDDVLLQMELRRAAMIWPDGFEWTEGEDGTPRAPIYRHSCCKKDPLGTVVAKLDSDKRPTILELRAADGSLRESLEVRSWQELRGRLWPREMVLNQGAPLLETVESVETRLHFLDLSFLPCDRRSAAGKSGHDGERVLAADLIAVTYREKQLPADIPWPEALERARDWIREAQVELKAQELEVDPVPTFELSNQGRATLCLVRLARAENPAPAGWKTVEERAGLLLALNDFSELDAAHLEPLFSSLPPDARAGRLYLRVEPRAEARLQLALPLEAVE